MMATSAIAVQIRFSTPGWNAFFLKDMKAIPMAPERLRN